MEKFRFLKNNSNGSRISLSNQQVKAIRAAARSYWRFSLACAARILFFARVFEQPAPTIWERLLFEVNVTAN
jgi:hypothetical protein